MTCVRDVCVFFRISFYYTLQAVPEQSIFLFTGPNRFALREAWRRWKGEFESRHGSENLSRLDGSRIIVRELFDEVSTAPFIATKRLVLVEGIPALEREQIEDLTAILHPDCVLVFIDHAPDRRKASVKAIFGIATVREFPLLEEREVQPWIVARARMHGSSIDFDAVRLLRSVVGDDLDTLDQEISKLALFAAGRPIAAADVGLLSVPSGEQEIWHLSRLLAAGDRRGCLRYAGQLLERGESAHALWNNLLWVVRSLVAVWSSSASGERNPGSVAASQKVPFPTVKTLLPLASRLRPPQIRSLLSWAAAADLDLKTGKFKATGEAPEELVALADRLLLLCTASEAVSQSSAGQRNSAESK